jgi:hypothetical protein
MKNWLLLLCQADTLVYRIPSHPPLRLPHNVCLYALPRCLHRSSISDIPLVLDARCTQAATHRGGSARPSISMVQTFPGVTLDLNLD